MSNDHKEAQFRQPNEDQPANRVDFSVGYYDDYVGSMQIFQLTKRIEEDMNVELIECFPMSQGEIALDYANQNAIELLPVTWSYRYWKNLTDETDLPRSLLDRLSDVFANTVERNIESRIPATLRRL